MLVFIDESGFPLPGDPCSRPVLCAVCIPKEYSRIVTGTVFNLKRSTYGIPADPAQVIEIHGHKLLTRSTFRRALPDTPAARAVQLLDGTMDAVEFMPIRVFAVIMYRPTFPPYYPEKHLAREYVALLQRINAMMDQEHRGKMATLVFDEQDLRGDMKRAFAFGQFFLTSTEGRTFWRILDTPFFVASQTCTGLQIADILARSIRIFKEENLAARDPADAFETAIRKYYGIAKGKTRNFFDPQFGQMNYGFYEMPLRLFPRAP